MVSGRKQVQALAALAVIVVAPLGVTGASAQEMQRICCSAAVPNGFIKVGDMWNPTDCGQPQQITYNQCYIERYDSQPVGATMDVCASAPTPAGWVVATTTWNPTKCGNPVQIEQNVKTIKRDR